MYLSYFDKVPGGNQRYWEVPSYFGMCPTYFGTGPTYFGIFLRSKEELYYIKAEYIIKLYTALSKYSRIKQLQISIPNLCKKIK